MSYTDKELLRASQIAYYTVNEEVMVELDKNKVTDYSLKSLYNNSDIFRNSIYKNISDVAGLGNSLDYENGDFNYEKKDEILNSITDPTKKLSVMEMYEVVGEIINGGEIASWKVVSYVDSNTNTDGSGIGVMKDGVMEMKDTPAVDNGMGAIVLDTGNNSAILAFRGSDAMHTTDLVPDWVSADAGLALGDDTPQQKYVETYLKQLDGLSYDNIAITGHSLGGNLAMHSLVKMYEEHPELAEKVSQVVGLDSPGYMKQYFNTHSEAFKKIAEADNLSVKHYEWSSIGALFEQYSCVDNSVVRAYNDRKGNVFLCHDTAFLFLNDDDSVVPGRKSSGTIIVEEIIQHAAEYPEFIRPELLKRLLHFIDMTENEFDKNNEVEPYGIFDNIGIDFISFIRDLYVYDPIEKMFINTLGIRIAFKLMENNSTNNAPKINALEIGINSISRLNMQSCVSQINTASKAKVDPLILDLDGDGYNIETKENGSYFDLDGNGYAERINWTKKDGFLCLDLNENGSIDSGAELFGDNTILADGSLAKNGFEALAQYDSNNDGIIDANDSIFGNLRVWVDGDGNGESGEGELKVAYYLSFKNYYGQLRLNRKINLNPERKVL